MPGWVITENIARGQIGRNESVHFRCLCSSYVITGARHVN